jgi:hypothetical protein
MSELYFPSLEQSQGEADSPTSVAELHGALCGLLCVSPHANRNNWVQSLYEDLQPDESEMIDLTAMFDDTMQSLNSLDFDLRLELPDDNAPLASRISAMTDWCNGLIFALGVSGLSDDGDMTQDCKEYITDVIQISQISREEIEETDEQDNNFEELVEYLRMGVFLLFNEFQPVSDEDNNTTEH